MEFEHAFQQSGYLTALQLMIIGVLLGPAALSGSALYQRFARAIASYVVTFGPMCLLVYTLYKVSQLS